MIRPSYPTLMNLIETNEVSIPREEFFETFPTIHELLAQDANPEEFIVNDPFLSKTR